MHGLRLWLWFTRAAANAAGVDDSRAKRDPCTVDAQICAIAHVAGVHLRMPAPLAEAVHCAIVPGI